MVVVWWRWYEMVVVWWKWNARDLYVMQHKICKDLSYRACNTTTIKLTNINKDDKEHEHRDRTN